MVLVHNRDTISNGSKVQVFCYLWVLAISRPEPKVIYARSLASITVASTLPALYSLMQT